MREQSYPAGWRRPRGGAFSHLGSDGPLAGPAEHHQDQPELIEVRPAAPAWIETAAFGTLSRFASCLRPYDGPIIELMSTPFLDECRSVLSRTPMVLDVMLRDLPEAWTSATE